MVAIVLYYHKFTKSLTIIGFEINPYDTCVTNKVIDGSQITILFQVDDFKLSHCERKANDLKIKWICQKYRSILEYGSGKTSVR